MSPKELREKIGTTVWVIAHVDPYEYDDFDIPALRKGVISTVYGNSYRHAEVCVEFGKDDDYCYHNSCVFYDEADDEADDEEAYEVDETDEIPAIFFSEKQALAYMRRLLADLKNRLNQRLDAVQEDYAETKTKQFHLEYR